ncbi:MAG: hypothetical protein ACRDRL_12345 [Sciscionella sp.]
MREYLVQYEGFRREDCPPAKRWEFYEDWGLTLQEFLQVAHDGVNAGVIFTFGEPDAGSSEALHMIKAAGHSVHIVTDRSFGDPGVAAHATIAWLNKHDLAFDTITFSSDKCSANVHLMVDDKLANYHALDNAGVWTWLLDRPWNQSSDNSIIRVESILDYALAVVR